MTSSRLVTRLVSVGLLLLLAGCSSAGPPSVIPPDSALQEPPEVTIPKENAPRDSATEGEGSLILGEGGGSETHTLILPTGALELGLVSLQAEVLGNVVDPDREVTARIAAPIGGYSVVPSLASYSVYGVDARTSGRLFARQFDEPGKVQVELTNLQADGVTPYTAPVRWTYKLGTTPDVIFPKFPSILNGWSEEQTWYGTTPILAGVPLQGTVMRGFKGRAWHMTDYLTLEAEAGETYKVTLTPKVQLSGWTWRFGYGAKNTSMFYPGMPDVEFGASKTVTITSRESKRLLLAVRAFADTPAAAGLEAASYTLLIERTTPTPPIIYSATIKRKYTQHHAPPENGMFTGYPGERVLYYIDRSGCACTGGGVDWSGGVVADVEGHSVLGDPGDYVAHFTLKNDAGVSNTFSVPYRVVSKE